jgi:O-antigen/teichoic acid export membrane protein
MARNVGSRYVAIVVDALIGLVLLPMNVAHLGPAAYGLWSLGASITMYFTMLDFGYGGSLTKFVAQYRALRNRSALNEIMSTMFVVRTTVALVIFTGIAIAASQVHRLFSLSPDQVDDARRVLLIIGLYVSCRSAIGIFGSVVYGFQRYYLNNVVSITSSVAVAIANVAAIHYDYGVVGLVAATTMVRVVGLSGFAVTAYRVYPGLVVSPRLFRRKRMREITGFSVYILVLDWSRRLNFSTDAIVIGAFLGTAPVAFWTVAQRLAHVAQQLTGQLSVALWPIVVDSDAAQRDDRLRRVLLQGTRMSLAMAVPVCVGLGMVAEPVVRAWAGNRFSESALITQILLGVVLVRIGDSSAALILKGAGGHRLLAFTNAGTAIVNLLLSLMAVKTWGLPGVAMSTLVPVACAAGFVLFPAACRRVGISLATAFRESVWPTLWPGLVMAAAIWAARPLAGTHLLQLAMFLVLAGLLYQLLFLAVAITKTEREYYWATAKLMMSRRRRMPAAA